MFGTGALTKPAMLRASTTTTKKRFEKMRIYK